MQSKIHKQDHTTFHSKNKYSDIGLLNNTTTQQTEIQLKGKLTIQMETNTAYTSDSRLSYY